MLRVYQNTIERLLLALSDEKEADEETVTPALTKDTGTETWPPWPWPPWGEDDDEDGHPNKPINHTRRARKFAKKVIELEDRLAKASLDL